MYRYEYDLELLIYTVIITFMQTYHVSNVPYAYWAYILVLHIKYLRFNIAFYIICLMTYSLIEKRIRQCIVCINSEIRKTDSN